MPKLIFPVQPDGMRCDVLIGLGGKRTSSCVKAGLPVLAPILCRGLIDTGTDISCVSATILRRLGLNQPAASGTTTSTTGTAAVDLFDVSAGVLNAAVGGPSLVLADLLVMELPASLAGIDVLIGLDVLLVTRLLLDGPARQFTLEF